MKKSLFVIALCLVAVLLVSCEKKTEPTEPVTTTTPTAFEPFVDESGDLNVYIGDFIYPEE